MRHRLVGRLRQAVLRIARWTRLAAIWLGVVAGLGAPCVGQAPAGSRANEILSEAIREYRTALETPDRDERLQRFQRAELLLARLLGVGEPHSDSAAASESGMETDGIRNPELYVSLGNAALGAEHLGRAIWAYRQALQIDPNHRRARQNLAHARTLLPEWVPRPESGGWLDSIPSGLVRWSAVDKRLVAACFFLVAACLMAAAIRWRWAVARNLAWLTMGFWVLLLAVAWATSRAADLRAAVVIEPDVLARAADSGHAPVRFSQPLPAGTEVEILEQRESWSQIRLADGRDAWVNRSTLDPIE